jgi:IclR family acetate operon transcriptional repressor
LFGDEPLTRYTPKTICSIEELAEECRRTRERGFAVDDQEMFARVRCTAAPIRDSSGEVVAAISITAPLERLSLRDRFRVGRDVLRVANEISAKLGYSHKHGVESTRA